MLKIGVVAKNELIRYFLSPLAYVYLISFLVLNASFALYFGHFFERSSADLSSMFAYQPWLYLLFVSGISMRLWAEEFRTKTIVQVVTMPVSITQLVWGKFLASWLFCLFALFLTFPFVITVSVLGTPDYGVIFSGYLASSVLAACMLAISQTMSSLTKNQVIALVLAVIANLIFFLSGLEYVLAFFRIFLPLPIVDMIASFSFLTHFNMMIEGLLEFRDIVFFLSLILLFNFTTILVVSFRTSGSSHLLKSASRNYYILFFICLLLAFVGINLLANSFLRRFQFDFTEEKVFTITEPTLKVLENIEYPVTAKLYYSKILEKKNPNLRQMFDKVRILLEQYARVSDGKFSFRIYNPEVFSNREDQALADGMQPLPIIDLNQNAFFGIRFTDELDNHAVIPFFALERINFLEQDLTSKIYTLNHRKKTVGILTPLSVFDTVQDNNIVTQKWQFVSQIEEFYNVVNVQTTDDIDGLDALIIVYPRHLTDAVVEKIKNYSNQGGKILLFADVAPEAARIYSPNNNDLLPSDLSGLDSFWGFRFNTQKVVADLTNSLTVDATNNYRTNPTFTQDVLQFILKQRNFNKQAPEMMQLNEILFASASVIEPLEKANVAFTPLISASLNSQLMPALAAQRSVSPERLLQNFQPDVEDKVLAAKIVSLDEKRPYQVIAVADTDMLYDSFWATSQVVLDKTYVVPLLDNVNFVLNSLESLIGEDVNLIGLRGKNARRRSFENVEKMRRDNERNYKVKEAEIFQKMTTAKKNMQDIWNKKDFEERSNFTPDELAVISGVRKTLDDLRLELADIRKNANVQIAQIDFKVKFFNIYFLPLLFLTGWGIWGIIRRKRRQHFARFQFNSQVFVAAGISLLILALGLTAVHFQNYNSNQLLEDTKVFPKLPDEINQITEISLTSHSSQLDFYKKEGIWYLKNFEHFPLYQERIRSFLSALLEARYYERKTSNAEFLQRFHLNPVADKDSKNLRIELKNLQGDVLEGFEVGKYDVDIGRGGRAAYIKFDDKFQVWLVAVDFIDLSTNWRDWTYSTLWNLRYGRLKSANDSSNTDFLALVMKYILNVPLEKEISLLSQDEQKALEKKIELKLETEDGSLVNLIFYKGGSSFYVTYDFMRIVDNNALHFVEPYVKDKFYQLSSDDMEKIDYVLTGKKSK